MTADPVVDAVCSWCGEPCETQLNPENANAYCNAFCRARAYEYRRDMRQADGAAYAHSDGPGSPQWGAECEEFGCHEQESDQL